VDEVLDRLRTAGQPLEFLEFFRDGWSRDRIVGIFLALLELVRRKAIQAEQKAGWHIEISLHGPAEAVRPPAEDLNRTQLSDSMGVAAHGN
jgi:hypothetical protein